MAFEDVIDSVKEWLNNRLKNPYFASVIAVWLVVNRIEMFGIFNFNDTQTVQDRVLWIQQQFQHKDIWGIGVFNGFSGSVWFSVSFGFITMIGFKYLKVISGIVYNFFDKGAVFIQKWDNPSKWKPIKDLEDLQKIHDKEKETFEKLRIDLIKRNQESETDLEKIKKEIDVSIQTQAHLKNRNGILEKEKENLGTEIQKLLKENKILESNQNLKNTDLYIDTDKILKNSTEKMKYSTLSDKLDVHKFPQNYETDIFGRSIELENFLKSEHVKSFEHIIELVMKHLPISPTVSEYVRDFYIANDLIGFKENHYIITPKGEEYYKAYLKTKEYK